MKRYIRSATYDQTSFSNAVRDRVESIDNSELDYFDSISYVVWGMLSDSLSNIYDFDHVWCRVDDESDEPEWIEVFLDKDIGDETLESDYFVDIEENPKLFKLIRDGNFADAEEMLLSEILSVWVANNGSVDWVDV